jgi:hypothetical protein
MKHWVGYWLMAVAVLHSIFAAFAWANAIQGNHAVWNGRAADPLFASAVWFMLVGLVLFICGLAVSALDRASSNQIPKSLGFCLFLLATVGVIFVPLSVFWLIFPPAITILAKPYSKRPVLAT